MRRAGAKLRGINRHQQLFEHLEIDGPLLRDRLEAVGRRLLSH